ncbi:hypothetical protein Y032_0208g2072 [Ancylostoma ceylanicum]|uniref:Uncharacterized protein n=3 Tax=Ancylostoma ceylanicum TaxID=53326 RepID=A0A016SLL8_9BILA|nr:hypothetical protein Y032_0208g2072 [Ancylostoma ceylanicum]
MKVFTKMNMSAAIFVLEIHAIPSIDRAVEVTQPYTGSLSVFALIYRTYGIIRQYIEDNRLETTIALEFYSPDEICVSFPLDHVKEFIVPEHMSLEALESKLARKKFDSDEESSESEAEQTSEVEVPEEGEIEVGAAGDKKDD